MTPERRAGTLVVFGLAAVAGALVAARPRRERLARARAATTAVAPPSLPRDPLAWVPVSTSLLAVADLDALRRAPATRALFAGDPDGVTPCGAALSRRIRRVVLVLPRLPLADFGFVASGDVDEAAFSACVEGAQATVREGLRIVTVASRRDASAPNAGTVAWTPSGIVLVGSRALVDAMLQRGFDALHGDASPLALAPMRRHADERAALWALALSSPDRPPDDDALAGVMGAAVSADVGVDVTFRASMLCDDSARARTVVSRLGGVRVDLAREVTAAPLRALLDSASFEADGAAVRVRATLDGAGLVTTAQNALRGLVAVPY